MRKTLSALTVLLWLASATAALAAERWVHVKVNETGEDGERVRVNIPLSLAEKVLPTINAHNLRNGKVRVDEKDFHDVDLRTLLDEEAAERQGAILHEIRRRELMRFRIGLDGLEHRRARPGDGVTAVVAERDLPLLEEGGVFAAQLDAARRAGARAAVVAVGRASVLERLAAAGAAHASEGLAVGLPVAGTPFLLDPLTRVGAKMLLNALSTCTMVRRGRVLGNRMICLVPSNLKLIDRSTRYVRDMAGVSYEDACRALFEVIDYVEPRRRAGKAYPAPVGVATMRVRHGLNLPEAEARLEQELA